MDGGPGPLGSVPHGEYQVDRRGPLAPAPQRVQADRAADGTGPLTFSGRDARHVRRVALGWWYTNRARHGLLVKEFFARCRLSADGRTISYAAR